jgi:hypothetical protein
MMSAFRQQLPAAEAAVRAAVVNGFAVGEGADPAQAAVADQLPELLLDQRIQAERRFVEDDQPRLMHERLNEPNLLLVAMRQVLVLAAKIQLQPLCQLTDALRVDAAAYPGEQTDDVSGRDGRELHQLARQVPDGLFDLQTVAAAVESQQGRGSPVGANEVHQQPDRGGLAGPIGADESEGLTRWHDQIEVEHPVAAAVVLGQPSRDDRWRPGLGHDELTVEARFVAT